MDLLKNILGPQTAGQDPAPTDQSRMGVEDDRLPSSAEARLESMLINNVTLLLAEKRTSLAVMRTGLAILALPTSVVSVLIVISKYYDPMRVIYLLAPLLAICVILTILGSYLITKSLRRISHLNRMVAELKQRTSQLRGLSIIMCGLIGPDNDF